MVESPFFNFQGAGVWFPTTAPGALFRPGTNGPSSGGDFSGYDFVILVHGAASRPAVLRVPANHAMQAVGRFMYVFGPNLKANSLAGLDVLDTNAKKLFSHG